MQSINIRFENGKVNIIVDGAFFKDVHSLTTSRAHLCSLPASQM